ncbi:Hypothetical predicted protein [Mytilus galloprovincialis]|uniref:Uncharacterized protein n=1 Tax=Mytilus galloprovincialis TaxID=29158 RepID=A0A8B6G0T2_MYTGA|nr:Hypothetical predicted protein [Mytilus galloprovincialis]
MSTTPTLTGKQEQQSKQKELMQQELKLKKREKQLRLTEAVVNDQSKEKNWTLRHAI